MPKLLGQGGLFEQYPKERVFFVDVFVKASKISIFIQLLIGTVLPGCMFANCGRARYNGARMCKAMGRACAK